MAYRLSTYKARLFLMTFLILSIFWYIIKLSSDREKERTMFQQVLFKRNEDSFHICVVGAGLSGAVIAERYATTTNKYVLVVEKRDHIGGNCFDFIDNETHIRVSKYGAHLFHTKYESVWNYVGQFSEWIPYEHKVLALIGSKYVPIPVNINTVNSLFGLSIKSIKQMNKWLKMNQIHYIREPLNSEEMALSRVGVKLYKLLFKPYTIKQWNKTPAELGPSVLARIPVRSNWDNRYFSDKYQALPKHGYTNFIKNMLNSQQITVRLNTDYFDIRNKISCGKTYFSGPIDRFYAEKGLPMLEYRSLSFERKVFKNINHFQPGSVVNHPSLKDNFTRIVEYKWLPNQPFESSDTVIFFERSTVEGEPYYPVPNEQNQNLYKLYTSFARDDPDIYFVGRLANYKYFNMDEAIMNALRLYNKTCMYKT